MSVDALDHDGEYSFVDPFVDKIGGEIFKLSVDPLLHDKEYSSVDSLDHDGEYSSDDHLVDELNGEDLSVDPFDPGFDGAGRG
jgi:hypothetical protein